MLKAKEHNKQEESQESSADNDNNTQRGPKPLIFGVNDTPPLHIMILYSFQMILSNLDGTIIVVYLIHSNICAEGNHLLFSQMMGTAIFMGGFCTLIQTTFGVRLPVYQGSTKAFLPPILAMMATEAWNCPESSTDLELSGTGNHSTYHMLINKTIEMEEPYKIRLQEISGALILCSVIQIVLGLTGIMGVLMSFIGPITIAPTIMLMALSLFRACAAACQHNWGIAIMTMVLIMFFPLVLGNVQVPIPSYSKEKGLHSLHFPVFKLFPQIMAISIVWMLCGILTATDVFPSDIDKLGYKARTDAKIESLQQASWFFFPYPFQYGTPRLSFGVVGGMIAAVLSSILDSIGDYIATARACSLDLPPKHAVNRGIAMEGLATVASGIVGAAHGTSSYGRAVGLIAITGVGSRSVMQVTGVMLMVFAVFGKVGAIFTLLPDPVIGGMATTACSIIVGVALSNLSYVDLHSARNQFVLGFSVFMGLMIPYFIKQNPDSIKTGVAEVDSIIAVVLSTGMLVGALIAVLFDNVLPGSKEMRGIVQLKEDLDLKNDYQADSHIDTKDTDRSHSESVYDLPFMKFIKKFKIFTYLPVCPTFGQRKNTFKRPVLVDQQSRSHLLIEVATV